MLKKIKTKKSNVKPLHPNSPLSNVNPERVIEALKLEQKEKQRTSQEIGERYQSVVDQDLAFHFNMIMSENLGKMTPFMKLFWEQQK